MLVWRNLHVINGWRAALSCDIGCAAVVGGPQPGQDDAYRGHIADWPGAGLRRRLLRLGTR